MARVPAQFWHVENLRMGHVCTRMASTYAKLAIPKEFRSLQGPCATLGPRTAYAVLRELLPIVKAVGRSRAKHDQYS